MLKKVYQELVAIRKELQVIRSNLELRSNITLEERTISQAVRKLKRNIKIKTEGLTQEENERIHSTLRLLNIRRRHAVSYTHLTLPTKA